MSASIDVGMIGGDVIGRGANEYWAEAEERRLFESEEGKHRRHQRTSQNIHWAGLLVFWVVILISPHYHPTPKISPYCESVAKP